MGGPQVARGLPPIGALLLERRGDVLVPMPDLTRSTRHRSSNHPQPLMLRSTVIHDLSNDKGQSQSQDIHVAKRSEPETPSSQQPQVTCTQTCRQPPTHDGPPPPKSQSESQEAKGSLLNKRKLTSKVWTHFKKVNEGGVSKAECNYCHIKLSAQSSAGTNHLQRHSERCAAENGAVVQPRQGLLSFTSSQATSKRVWIFSQEKT
ncbi:hypothetical protein PTTG_28701 [Puccinia triticina 1-1 BBBD Race 1]|uniref:BED-type domain-containing protein n=1 Tax=Puccinia triticina (isolate 1-1 / race 1 (BBBD)) TaxID=630390 RepID=A0A180GAA5_PUCT1|nr:hypothetical protein PTTG_28701 [Puccinia triticina 1-1 BBBD Race 1]